MIVSTFFVFFITKLKDTKQCLPRPGRHLGGLEVFERLVAWLRQDETRQIGHALRVPIVRLGSLLTVGAAAVLCHGCGDGRLDIRHGLVRLGSRGSSMPVTTRPPTSTTRADL